MLIVYFKKILEIKMGIEITANINTATINHLKKTEKKYLAIKENFLIVFIYIFYNYR